MSTAGCAVGKRSNGDGSVRESVLTQTEEVKLVSFDGGIERLVMVRQPDRYRLIEANAGHGHQIARGGGYSYAAASFGAGAVSVDMRHFNRLLRFDPGGRTIEVEAGLTLGELLEVTSFAGLALSVQPGYPAVTVGGCIAANVHGKNPLREGTFRDALVDMTLFHPSHGIFRVTREHSRELFDLTTGGYGLTGVILSATLCLSHLGGTRVAIRRVEVGNLREGLELSRQLAAESLFAYTWHDATARSTRFGRGFVYQGSLVPGDPRGKRGKNRYRVLTPTARARLPFSFWYPATICAFASAFRWFERCHPPVTETTLFDALFPFARRSIYFRLFGRQGLVEYQVIVPDQRIELFLEELRRLILGSDAPAVMLSLKPSGGERGLLRFEGNGTCVTLDLQRSAATSDLLKRIDELTIEVGGIPNIIKDSRLPKSVVKACYPDYERFREGIRSFDPRRIFMSELSNRLDL
jgi:decaprenylphospho-beta-D-ribofuranose 2-oxidase